MTAAFAESLGVGPRGVEQTTVRWGGAPPLMGSLLAEGCVGWGREPPMNTALHRAGTGDEDAADEQQHTRGRGIAS